MKLRPYVFSLMLVSSLLLSACGSLSFGPGAPNVRITAPEDGTTYASGVSIAVIGTAGGAGVRTVRVLINGVPVAMQTVTEMFTPVALSWTPDRSGTHIVHLEALDVDGTLLARSDLVMVQVLGSQAAPSAPAPVPATATATAAATQTAIPTDSPTALPTALSTALSTTVVVTATATAALQAAPTLSPTVLPTILPTSSPTSAPTETVTPSPTLKVIVPMANLRSGPGFDYPLAGQAAQGDVLPIIGRDAAGAWWMVQQLTKTLWIAGVIVETEATERDVPLVAVATRVAATAATVTPAVPTATATPTATIAPDATPTDAAAAGMAPCDENNPHWAVKESKDPGYTFCAAVPFEFVEQSNDGRMLLRWHMYGIEQLELRIDPNGSSCGLGSTGFRQIVPFKLDAYELNRRNFPRGGYKIGLWATLPGGRVQDYGELNFCGEG